MLATSLSGEIPFNEDGSFTFQFPTTGLSGSLTVKVTAEDWNTNIDSVLITLVDQGAIPSFDVKPGNKTVTLSWDPVPLSESYTLYYEKADVVPNEDYSQKIENVSTPYTLSGLVNGDMHTFLLRSHSSAGEDNWSDVVKVIPLSYSLLAPRLIPGLDSIHIEWTSINSTDEYTVWKTTSPNDPFSNISGVIKKNSFIDKSVQKDKTYFYAVKPAYYNDMLSDFSAEQLRFFPTNNEREIGSVDTSGQAMSIVLKDNYAYVADGWLSLIFRILPLLK